MPKKEIYQKKTINLKECKIRGIPIKRLLILIFISLQFFIKLGSALPIITEMMIYPETLWLDQSGLNISVNCSENDGNYTISKVYLNITGPDIFIPDWNMKVAGDNKYTLSIGKEYFYKAGNYQINTYCESNSGEKVMTSKAFKIYQLSSEITKVYPEEIFIGDELEINCVVKKDNFLVTSGILFTLKVGDYIKNFSQPPPIYDSSKGWVIKTDKIDAIGQTSIVLEAEYQGAKSISKKQIEIKQPLQFNLINIDKNWVKDGDNITLTFLASYKGKPMEITKNNLKFWIGDSSCDILEMSSIGNNYYVKIKVPNYGKGNYEMKIRLEYQDFVKEIKEKIQYVIPISGRFLDPETKPINVGIIFRKNQFNTMASTDSSGYYYIELPSGKYNVDLEFPRSTVFLKGVDVEKMKDFMRYDEPTNQIEIEGIGIGGVFVYEIATPFDDAYIEMRYDEGKIDDENRIVVFKCGKWNFAKRLCNEDWSVIKPEIDTIRNIVKFNTSQLATYLIGYKKQIFIQADSDKKEYNLNDLIKVSGIIEDEDQKPVINITINGQVIGTDIKFSSKTDKGGFFISEFIGPSKEGKYEIELKAQKKPFDYAVQTISIEIIKSKKLELTVPKSVQITQGENKSSEFYLNNIGQTDFQNVKIFMENIPSDYYELLESEFSDIKAGESKNIPIIFKIPKDAAAQNYNGKIKVNYDGGGIEKDILINIVQLKLNENRKDGYSVPTGKFFINKIPKNEIIVFIIGIIALMVVLIIKSKMRKRAETREDIKNSLLYIKKEVEKSPMKIQQKKLKKKLKRGKKNQEKESYFLAS